MCKCLATGVPVKCWARKYVADVSKLEANFLHIGEQTCVASLPEDSPTDIVNSALSVDPNINPSTIRKSAMLAAIRGHSTSLLQVVSSTPSTKKISNEKIKQKKLLFPDRCSFERHQRRKWRLQHKYPSYLLRHLCSQTNTAASMER